MFLTHWNGKNAKCRKLFPCMLGSVLTFLLWILPKSVATAQCTSDLTRWCHQVKQGLNCWRPLKFVNLMHTLKDIEEAKVVGDQACFLFSNLKSDFIVLLEPHFISSSRRKSPAQTPLRSSNQEL